MKIFLDGFNGDFTGYVFLGRLVSEMQKLGVTFQYVPQNADVILYMQKNNFCNTNSSLPKAFRPIHIHMTNYGKSKQLNDARIGLIRKSDLVIWQCEWLKNKYKILAGCEPKKNESIIYNAIDISPYKNYPEVVCQTEKMVISLCAWAKKGINRPRKRFDETVSVAYDYVNSHKNTTFYIIGENNGTRLKHDRIKIIGKLFFDQIVPYLKRANAMLNLSYFDNCPNSVVEALAFGVPVVLNDETGATELIGENGGIVVNIDRKITKFQEKREPSKIVNDKVVGALEKILFGWPKFEKPQLNINFCAKKYKEEIEKICR